MFSALISAISAHLVYFILHIQNTSSFPKPLSPKEEKEMLEKINALGIGAEGFRGDVTALRVFIETENTHIAGLPVAVTVQCHCSRHGERIIEG